MPPDPNGIPRSARVARLLMLLFGVSCALLLAWPLVSGLGIGPFAPKRPSLAHATALPAGSRALAAIGPEDAPAGHVTAAMPAGWYVEDGTGVYGDDYATITVTAFPLASGHKAESDEDRTTVARTDSRTSSWRLGPVERRTVNGRAVVALAFSGDPVEWAGVRAYVFLDGLVVRVECAYDEEQHQSRAVDGCLTVLADVAVTA